MYIFTIYNSPNAFSPSDMDESMYKNTWGSKVDKNSIWSWARHSSSP